jgi:hypothetical protein
MFGSKKIFAKIMNGKLVIRVGGGFMVIEEFIATYADLEIRKLQNMEGGQDDASNGAMSGKNKGYSSNRKSPRSGSGAMSYSPRNDFNYKKSL